MQILIERGGQRFGPYPLSLAQQYLATGKLLPQDLAQQAGTPGTSWVPLSALLKQAGAGGGPSRSIFSRALTDIKSFDPALVVPWREVVSLRWLSNRRLIYLALI